MAPLMSPDAPTEEPATKPATPEQDPGQAPPVPLPNPRQPDPAPLIQPEPDRETCPDGGPCRYRSAYDSAFVETGGPGDLTGASFS